MIGFGAGSCGVRARGRYCSVGGWSVGPAGALPLLSRLLALELDIAQGMQLLAGERAEFVLHAETKWFLTWRSRDQLSGSGLCWPWFVGSKGMALAASLAGGDACPAEECLCRLANPP